MKKSPRQRRRQKASATGLLEPITEIGKSKSNPSFILEVLAASDHGRSVSRGRPGNGCADVGGRTLRSAGTEHRRRDCFAGPRAAHHVAGGAAAGALGVCRNGGNAIPN